MPAKLKPRAFRLEGCSVMCSINARNLPAGGAEAVHRWYEQGASPDLIVNNAKSMGWSISRGAAVRHKTNHLVPEDHYADLAVAQKPVRLDPEGNPLPQSDLAILDAIVQAGAKQMQGHSVRISPEMTMKAMELRLKLTQGSVFDDFMAAVGKAFGADDRGLSLAPEDPIALADVRELGQAGDERSA